MDPNQGPDPTLKDQIYSGEILKRMYHKKLVQTAEHSATSEAKFYELFKANCNALALEEKVENEINNETTKLQDMSSMGETTSVISGISGMSKMSIISKRPSEMNDVELQE